MGIETKHNERSSQARSLVEEYRIMKGDPFDHLGIAITDDCLEEIVIDLITDVLILAYKEGIDINSVYRMVANHVSAETELVEVKEEA
ncbi:MAG TPA: hypothetical protein EYG88_02315 [Desulfocapsa sulfexigens]|nr:hypothetical protein [Desulfocapsa sulfexigens]